mgnify:FL=1
MKQMNIRQLRKLINETINESDLPSSDQFKALQAAGGGPGTPQELNNSIRLRLNNSFQMLEMLVDNRRQKQGSTLNVAQEIHELTQLIKEFELIISFMKKEQQGASAQGQPPAQQPQDPRGWTLPPAPAQLFKKGK